MPCLPSILRAGPSRFSLAAKPQVQRHLVLAVPPSAPAWALQEVCEHVVEVGDSAEEIAKTVQCFGTTQVVMGGRGLSPIKEVLL